MLALSGKYDELFTYVMFMMVLSYVLTVVGLFILRRKKPDVPRPYRCTGYPVAAGDLRGAGQLVGDQRGGGKKKRDAGGNGDRAAGSTILFLLEEAEES